MLHHRRARTWRAEDRSESPQSIAPAAREPLLPAALPAICAGAELPSSASVVDIARECQSEVFDCSINAFYQPRSELPEFGRRFPELVRLMPRLIRIAAGLEVWYQEAVGGGIAGCAGRREAAARSDSGRMP
jgi:hypothetical protein